MFLLKNLPTAQMLENFKERYPEMDVKNVMVCLHMMKAASVILKDLEQYFSNNSFSFARFLCLIIIERERNPELLSSDIAEHMGVSRKNTSRLLHSLDQSQMITIIPCSKDKRASIISLTEQGSQKLNDLLPGYYNRINAHFNHLDAQEKTHLESTLFSLLSPYEDE